MDSLLVLFSLFVLVVSTGRPACAIDLVIDYTYDTTNWFGSGNPDGSAAGAQAKASLENAAQFFSDILDDSFSEIVTPPNYQSSNFGGEVSWYFDRAFTNPTTGGNVTLSNVSVAADEYRIFAGARTLSGTTLGVGGPGGGGWGNNIVSQGFTQSEIDEVDVITSDFFTAVQTRGEPSGFTSWGGAITFDRVANWHYDHTVNPTGNQNDFFSVALHELGHAIGLGASQEWDALVSGGVFLGSASSALFGANVPVNPSGGHWAEGTMSTIYGTSTAQESIMTPSILSGSRTVFTDLDAAGLTDIGWTVIPLPVSFAACDFDQDGDCDPVDIDALYANFGSNDAAFDVDGDGSVGNSDISAWLSGASATSNPFNASSKTFVLGDLDFDGAVDSTDLGLLLNNFADTSGLLYRAGNLTDDSSVDSVDLGLLLNNFSFTSSASSLAVSAVPEPAGFALWLPLMLPILGVLSCGRRSRHGRRK